MTRTRDLPSGYRLVLPEGWVGLNVREDTDDVVAAAMGQLSFAELPVDERAPRRAAIEGRLRRAVAGAKKIDAYSMYLPLKGMDGLAVPASFVVAEATDFSGVGATDEVLEHLLAEPGAQRALVDGSDAVRTESHSSGTDDASGVELRARQVVYTIAVPDAPQWLVVVFDVLHDTSPAAEALRAYVDAVVMLFDSIMSTFRWEFPPTV